MESYSPSIQKLCVFLKPQSDISNNGISYLNNFLNDMSNAIIVESIHSSKSHKHKTILIEDIESALNIVFPADIADSIISQSKGRIQQTSQKNLMQVKTFTDDYDQQLPNSSSTTTTTTNNKSKILISDDEESDSDVEGFEIINANESDNEDNNKNNNDNNNTNSNNNNNNNNTSQNKDTYSHEVSLCFPIEMVYRVTMDYICRKKVIHNNPSDFYKLLEQQQDSNHLIYTFISYALEIVTTKILMRISNSTEIVIDDDIIRNVIQDNPSLNSIRHKNIQASNIASKLLDSSKGGISNPDLQTSLSSSFILSNIINTNTTDTQKSIDIDKLLDDAFDNTTTTSNSKIISQVNSDDDNHINKKKEDEIILKSFNNTENNNNIIEEIAPIISTSPTQIVNNNNNNVKNEIKTTNVQKINNNNNIESIKSIIEETCKNISTSSSCPVTNTRRVIVRGPPSLFKITEPIDLVQVLADGGIHLEVTNGMFLVLLVLMGFVIQHVTHTPQVLSL